jgi:hypothetical protein
MSEMCDVDNKAEEIQNLVRKPKGKRILMKLINM